MTDGWDDNLSSHINLNLREKYESQTTRELRTLSNVPHIEQLYQEYRYKDSTHKPIGVTGNLNLSYAFLKPSLPSSVRLMKAHCTVEIVEELQTVSIVYTSHALFTMYMYVTSHHVTVLKHQLKSSCNST